MKLQDPLAATHLPRASCRAVGQAAGARGAAQGETVRVRLLQRYHGVPGAGAVRKLGVYASGEEDVLLNRASGWVWHASFLGTGRQNVAGGKQQILQSKLELWEP